MEYYYNGMKVTILGESDEFDKPIVIIANKYGKKYIVYKDALTTKEVTNND